MDYQPAIRVIQQWHSCRRVIGCGEFNLDYWTVTRTDLWKPFTLFVLSKPLNRLYGVSYNLCDDYVYGYFNPLTLAFFLSV